jgi:hypothetical protein
MDKKQYKKLCKSYSQTCDRIRELNNIAKDLQRRILNSNKR